jgi:hypothetical protein
VVSGKVVWVSHVPCTCKGEREKERHESEARAEEEDSLRKERLSRIGIPRLYQGAMPADEACKAYASCFSSDLYRFFGHGIARFRIRNPVT